MDLRSFPRAPRFKLTEVLSRRPLLVPSLDMKQNTVIKVKMKCSKCKREALATAAKYGANSMAVEGSDDDQLVLSGEGVDWVELTRSLRTKHRSANISSVQEVTEKAEKPEEKPNPEGDSSGSSSQFMQLPYYYQFYQPVPYDCPVVVYDPWVPSPNICTIM